MDNLQEELLDQVVLVVVEMEEEDLVIKMLLMVEQI
jgi:hypothetical protein|tara:strand:- start:104 stop:211 length:108 start_codon:yes stop_codon:yes gene_type:complete